MYNEIRALEHAKDCYMLDANMSLVECVKHTCFWDVYLWNDSIATIRKAAGTDHLVQWEADHSREDGVHLFDDAIQIIKNRPVRELLPWEWLVYISIPLFILAALVSLAFPS